MPLPTPEQIRQFLVHTPLRYGLAYFCEHTEHICQPETCDEECWQAACTDLARWIKEISESEA